MNNLPTCPWCKQPPEILNISPMEVCCVTEGCPPHLNAVSAEVWSALSPHHLEVSKIPANEPIFVLRAQDSLSLVPVYTWIDNAEKKKVNQEKLDTAVARAEEMQSFQRAEVSKLPD